MPSEPYKIHTIHRAGMLFMGISRVRSIEGLWIVADVNEFNSCTDAWSILVDTPDIARVDPYVSKFMLGVVRAEAAKQTDAEILARVFPAHARAEGKEDEPMCLGCGGAPTLVTLPCGHVGVCGPCNKRAAEAGACSCMACGAVITRTERIRLVKRPKL